MIPGLPWVLGLVGLSLVLVLLRLVRGPSLADRIVALDLLATLGVSLLAGFALLYRQPAFLDVAILLALVGFLGSVAFARTMEESPEDDSPGDTR